MSKVNETKIAECSGCGECWKQHFGCVCDQSDDPDSEIECKGTCEHAHCKPIGGGKGSSPYCRNDPCSHNCELKPCPMCGDLHPEQYLDCHHGNCYPCNIGEVTKEHRTVEEQHMDKLFVAIGIKLRKSGVNFKQCPREAEKAFFNSGVRHLLEYDHASDMSEGDINIDNLLDSLRDAYGPPLIGKVVACTDFAWFAQFQNTIHGVAFAIGDYTYNWRSVGDPDEFTKITFDKWPIKIEKARFNTLLDQCVDAADNKAKYMW